MSSELDASGETKALRRSPVTHGLEGLCALMLAVMVVLLFIQVAGRYVFSDPPDWTEELARGVFIYLTFVGGALAIVRNAHLRIEGLHERLSPRMKTSLDIVLILVGVIFLVVTLYQSIGLLSRLSHQPMTSVPISKAFVFAAVPIGCALMLVYELLRVRNYVRALVQHRRGPKER
jgi:TRAP-type C4-dicarboxylate transport system permease small subunit